MYFSQLLNLTVLSTEIHNVSVRGIVVRSCQTAPSGLIHYAFDAQQLIGDRKYEMIPRNELWSRATRDETISIYKLCRNVPCSECSDPNHSARDCLHQRNARIRLQYKVWYFQWDKVGHISLECQRNVMAEKMSASISSASKILMRRVEMCINATTRLTMVDIFLLLITCEQISLSISGK